MHQTSNTRPFEASDPNSLVSRRSFLAATAAVGVTATALGRDQGPSPAPTRYPDPNIIVLDKRFARYKVSNTPIQRLYTGTLWAEGPAWSGVGRFLVWSDIPNNVQLRRLDEDGHVSVFRNPSNYTNGNTFDWQGRQLSCEHGTRRVVRYEHDGKVTVLADNWHGKPLNAPNDIVVHPDGGIWFSDPGYGTLGNYEGNKGELVIKEAVYRIDPNGRKMEIVTDAMYKPNGLCFSPDYKKLYIADTGASALRKGAEEHPGLRRHRWKKARQRARVHPHGPERQGRTGGRPPRRRGRQPLGGSRLGRRRVRRRPHLRPRRQTYRPDPAPRNLQQRLLRRPAPQPPLHDRQPVAVRRLRRNAGSRISVETGKQGEGEKGRQGDKEKEGQHSWTQIVCKASLQGISSGPAWDRSGRRSTRLHEANSTARPASAKCFRFWPGL